MKVYETSQIRNVVLLGHGGSGKTTIAEAMAFVSGAITKMGTVTAGNTISDYDKEEQKRGFSISTSLIPIEYTDKDNGPVKLNVLDTPGYFDFVGEVEEAASAADAAIIVINCKAGIEPGTIKAWELCELYRLPRIIFVTNMDDDKASYRELILKLQSRFGKKVAPIHMPIRENEKFVGFVNVVKQQGRKFTSGAKYEDYEVPADSEAELEKARESLLEAVAESSEEFMDRYFSGDTFTEVEIYTALREMVKDCELVPVMMGSGVNAQGAFALMNAIVRYLPSPLNAKQEEGVDPTTAATAMLKSKPSSQIKINALGDINCLSCYYVMVQDAATGLAGRYWISSDTHTWQNGIHTMELDLEFEAMMNEKEIKEEDKDKKKEAAST